MHIMGDVTDKKELANIQSGPVLSFNNSPLDQKIS